VYFTATAHKIQDRNDLTRGNPFLHLDNGTGVTDGLQNAAAAIRERPAQASPEPPVGREKFHVHDMIYLWRDCPALLTIYFNDIKSAIPVPFARHEPICARPEQVRLLPAVNGPKPASIG
jgi:hypothetical protein